MLIYCMTKTQYVEDLKLNPNVTLIQRGGGVIPLIAAKKKKNLTTLPKR